MSDTPATIDSQASGPSHCLDESLYLHAMGQSLHAGLLVVNQDGALLYASRGFERISGWQQSELQGKGLMKCIPAHLHRFMLERWNTAWANCDIDCYDMQILHKDQHIVPVMITHQPLVIGERVEMLFMIQDLVVSRANDREQEQYRERLEQKVQERTAALVDINSRLKHSEMALARAQASAHIGSWEWRQDQVRPEWSRQMFFLHGLEPDQQPPTIPEMFSFVHPDDREQVQNGLQRVLQTHESCEQEYRLVRPDGSVIDVVGRMQPYRHPFGTPHHLYGTLQDITERRRLERQIVEASQSEQQRIGRDLHDTLGQELTGLSLIAKALENRIAETAPDQAQQAAELSRIAAMAASHARDISHGLSPVDIAEEGLSAELQRMSARVSHLYAIDCRFVSHNDDRVHDNAVATHVYHIAQEAVTNAVKHAKPTHVQIDLWGGNPGRLIVTNDHQQTETALVCKVPPAGDSLGSGLRIMRHRADIIKAKLAIAHHPDGSNVTCIFPNAPPHSDHSPDYRLDKPMKI